MTEQAKKLVTLFGSVCEVTRPATKKESPAQNTMVLTNVKTGDTYYVFKKVVDTLPETIRRDSFTYKPNDRD